jgi:hypothetical protein
MSDSTNTDLILVQATEILSVTPSQAPDSEPEHVRAALRRCRAAWQRAYRTELDKSNGNDGDDVFACFYGGKAYRRAMPILSTYESVQAYIACATHGLLIGAIAPEESGHILYAAQVALGALNFAPKSRKLTSS